MAKTVTIRMDDDTYEAFSTLAAQERRPLGKCIEMAAYRYLRHNAFVDDEEMDAILRDQNLVRRLRQGTADAKARRGRFVKV
ncbi:MAG: CopG family transcriptional regulator [Deltaproteobacteria bacterium]|nr:CopG family transcriptional regulator [Deltaproteobacteria bacterium]